MARTQASSRQRPDVEQATRRLQAALADAQRQGYAGYQFDARLALAEVQASRAQLEKLQKDAHAAGFETIARSAARALEKLKA